MHTLEKITSLAVFLVHKILYNFQYEVYGEKSGVESLHKILMRRNQFLPTPKQTGSFTTTLNWLEEGRTVAPRYLKLINVEVDFTARNVAGRLMGES